MEIKINKRWHINTDMLTGMTKEGFIEAFRNAGTGEDLSQVWEKVKQFTEPDKKSFQDKLSDNLEKKEEKKVKKSFQERLAEKKQERSSE